MCQMADTNGRDIGHFKQKRRAHTPMPGDNAITVIDENWTHEAKLRNAGGDLPDVLIGMGSRIGFPRFQRRWVFVDNLKFTHGDLAFE